MYMVVLTIIDVIAIVIAAYAFANHERMEAKDIKNGALLLGLVVAVGHLVLCLI